MARGRASGRSGSKKRLPGWAILLLGLVLGVASVLVTQLIVKRAGSTDGLAGLFTLKPKRIESPVPKRAEPAAPAKPKLDFYTVLPELETVLPERGSRTRTARTEPTAANTDVRYILQAGSFATFQEADQLKARLALQGLQAQIQKVTIEGKGEYHRVRLGPYEKQDELDSVSRELSKLGIKPIRLAVKKAAG